MAFQFFDSSIICFPLFCQVWDCGLRNQQDSFPLLRKLSLKMVFSSQVPCTLLHSRRTWLVSHLLLQSQLTHHLLFKAFNDIPASLRVSDLVREFLLVQQTSWAPISITVIFLDFLCYFLTYFLHLLTGHLQYQEECS